MLDSLEAILDSLDGYDGLPEVWRVPEIERFSSKKTLYGYQTEALRNAARALYRYYKGSNGWHPHETQGAVDDRNKSLMELYYARNVRANPSETTWFSINKYETDADAKNEKQSLVFKILSKYVSPNNDVIPYHHFINRMCFWMATGSGKTLVMVKLIEYLHSLQRHGEIPPHNILILAPSDHLIGQIRNSIDEFNQSGGLHMEMVPLRQAGKDPYQRLLGDAATIYCHRSDNISDVQKDALTDYREYENDGKWYVLLDEAHKGGKDESKRQAYYALMARRGFLFNFSATFTDKVDIATTVKKYNLEEFTKNGYGKSIYLSNPEYVSFQNRTQEIGHDDRRAIVLKSLITLAHASIRVEKFREKTGFSEMYHRPLMMTLVNSVNTDIENDLWMFFQTLREIATGSIGAPAFKDAKAALLDDWMRGKPLFGRDGEKIIDEGDRSVMSMKITDLRAKIFLSRRKGALQLIRGKDNKELAFQMKNADSPFALIRIGDTSKWSGNFLAGYEETGSLQGTSFFDELNSKKSSITILMGSRAFFESWDSNRPNVINFINIGGHDAKKFVVQAIGRGVRIEVLPGKRGRLFRHHFDGDDKEKVARCRGLEQPPETLFVFATNRAAIQSVLLGLEMEKSLAFENLDGFERAPAPKIDNEDMPLLIPVYKDDENLENDPGRFAMSKGSLSRLKAFVEKTSDSVFAVRDGLDVSKISELRRSVTPNSDKIQVAEGKNYLRIPFLLHRIVSHLSKRAKISDGVRNLCREDIVHFRHVQAHPEHAVAIQRLIRKVRQGKAGKEQIHESYRLYKEGEITEKQLKKRLKGKNKAHHNELIIKRLLHHYYSPVVLGKETSDYIRHIVKVKSEVDFLNDLERWLGELPLDEEYDEKWDAWMFSKLDESLDRTIHILYFDSRTNEYRRFQPDFIFWMCNRNNRQYRILFVDPKGGEHTDAYRKIEGYKQLFEENGQANSNRKFFYDRWRVSVDLLMYNPNTDSALLEPYKEYWAAEPGNIFRIKPPGSNRS